MKKLGRRARKRRHLQRARQVASKWHTPPAYFRTKTKLYYKCGQGVVIDEKPYEGENEFVVDFSREGGRSPNSCKVREAEARMLEDD